MAGPAESAIQRESASRATLLLGAASLDIYPGDGRVLPGGGALNVAWHWARLGFPFRFLTRIGNDRPEVFLKFMDRHGIRYLPRSIVDRGPSASIDVLIQSDRQPHMDNFVDGVWRDFRLDAAERTLLASAERLHVILVEGAIREIHRLGAEGALRHLEVAADFLGFRHYTVERMAETLRFVDVAFVGWPGDVTDPTIDGIRRLAFEMRKLIVVTLGSRGVLVLDGRAGASEVFVPVQAVPVAGTTVGCGDAFIAAFLAAYWRSGDVLAAVAAGKENGAAATAWPGPLPESAYGDHG
ncbi:MAG: PfkB domain protein [Chloroflexi bacterium]|nr:PfkB domain protein [Chloroflexota bacterium]